jgi:PKD repeat protein
MVAIRKVIAIAVALTMAVVGFAGCLDDEGNGTDWKNPTQIVFSDLSGDEATQVVLVNFTLGDKEDLVTQADGSLQVAIWDSDGFEMLNKTFTIKAKDFKTLTVGIIKSTSYSLKIPYADFEKSHDRGYNALFEFTERTMHGTVWFTFKGDVLTASYDFEFLNPEIPDGLLHPNVDPNADLRGGAMSYVGFVVTFNASESTDMEGGSLMYMWDFGDEQTTSMGDFPVQEHTYDAPGVYEVSVTVQDPEEAEDVATMDITVDWAIAAGFEAKGKVTEPGVYINHTWVDLIILNQAPEEATIPELNAVLMDDSGGEIEAAGTDITVPSTIEGGGSVTVRIYFDTPTGFDSTRVQVFDRPPMSVE